MHHAVRTQHDGLGELYSIRGGLSCEGSKDMARQEFKDEADINIMLTRFGIHDQARTVTQFGEADYTIDLQQAMHAVNDAKRAYQRMDPEIHKLYPSFQKFMQGMNSGDLARDMKKLDDDRKPETVKQQIREDLARQKTREELIRADEADRLARDYREGRTSPKEDNTPK